MSPTIYDIARIANVSKSTVSRVLNNQTNISDEARERVLKAIEELDYQPNKLARALTSSGFDAIMVISSRSTKTTSGNPFFSDVLHAITAKAESEGFDVILQTSKNSEEDLQKCLSKIKQKMIKGIIMLSSPVNEHFFVELDKYNIPVVVIGRLKGQYQHIFSVDTDNFNDSITLTQTLIDKGFTRIACLHAPLDYHVSRDRLEGFTTALERNGLALDPSIVMDGGYTQHSALAAAEILLTQTPLPEAIFATDSLKLMSLYRVAARLNIAIPQSLAVIGYSDAVLSFMLTPPPSGIEVPIKALGDTSSALLFERIARQPTPQSILIATENVITGSLP
ncbi:LacI family DNA-binding transcriptional regulator [Atlantibacter sp.]|uniref:LacI family DNA-binding transcriptional regulator n=1 Tax=Atlantibacter sp. TaxID=1903473 RepID=UPI0028A2ACF6|nr:LacI family DNA-binding transcriptional regulator [Atlantibacter sp.]